MNQARRSGEVAVPGLPLTLYNVPGRTSVSLAADTIDRLHQEIAAAISLETPAGS